MYREQDNSHLEGPDHTVEHEQCLTQASKCHGGPKDGEIPLLGQQEGLYGEGTVAWQNYLDIRRQSVRVCVRVCARACWDAEEKESRYRQWPALSHRLGKCGTCLENG